MNPRPSNTKARRDCFDLHRKADETGRIYLVCHICAGRIYPGREAWEADHRVRRVVGGSDLPTNVMPAHERCHAVKSKDDVRENAKGKRVADKHFGIKRAKGPPIPGSKRSRWKKKLNGEVVRRDRP